MSKKEHPVTVERQDDIIERQQKQINDLLRERATLAETVSGFKLDAQELERRNLFLRQRADDAAREAESARRELEALKAQVRAVAHLLLSLAPDKDKLKGYQMG